MNDHPHYTRPEDRARPQDPAVFNRPVKPIDPADYPGLRSDAEVESHALGQDAVGRLVADHRGAS